MMEIIDLRECRGTKRHSCRVCGGAIKKGARHWKATAHGGELGAVPIVMRAHPLCSGMLEHATDVAIERRIYARQESGR